MIIQIIAGLVIFLGLISGFLINKLANEEILKYKKFFIILEMILILVIIISLLYGTANFSWIISLIIGLIIGYFIRELYLSLGLSLVLSSFITLEMFAFVSSLIFILLMIYNAKNKIKVKNMSISIVLFLLPLILLISDRFIENNINILLGFSAGVLISLIYFNYIGKIRNFE